MAATPATDKDRLANRSSTAGAQPVPAFQFPPLPARIVQIDPVGCAQWQQNVNRLHAEWVAKVNVINGNIASQIKP